MTKNSSYQDAITFLRSRIADLDDPTERAALTECLDQVLAELGPNRAFRDIGEALAYKRPWIAELKQMLARFAGHPDYRDEWKPETTDAD